MARLDEIGAEIQSIRDKMDDADRTPFGDMEHLLDACAKHADTAMALIEQLKRIQEVEE